MSDMSIMDWLTEDDGYTPVSWVWRTMLGGTALATIGVVFSVVLALHG